MVKRRSKYEYCKILKGFDMFGYQIQFKYEGNDNVKKSIYGGFFTILAMSFIIAVAVMKLGKVNSQYENDALVREYDVTLAGDQIRNIDLDDTQFKLFHVIRKNGSETFDVEEMSRYLKPKYYQYVEDWNLEGDGRTTYIEYPAKKCEAEDLYDGQGSHTESQGHLDAWKGFYMLCPDVSKP